MFRFCGVDRWLLAFALCLVFTSLSGAHAAESKRILLLLCTEEGTTPAMALFESGVLNQINQDFGSAELYRERLEFAWRLQPEVRKVLVFSGSA